MKRLGVRKWLILLFLLLLPGVVLWQWFLDQHRDQEKALRSDLRQSLAEHFPVQAERSRRRHGLVPWSEAPAQPLDRPQVVLVHGLDDPGKVWMNLAPALDEAGYQVWIMNYPDDQPIRDSARLLADELERLRGAGVERLALVAHSMGGLVSREFLTNPTFAGRARPRIAVLIMVGTPNQGSEMARFRGLAEWRDQVAELVNGDFVWLGWVFDGAGEAGIDLLPGSRFLNELNSRSQPSETRLSVIAAVLGQSDIARLRGLAGADGAAFLAWLNPASEALGDGLVPVASAQLEGAEFHLVEGTHLSMIRNVLESSQRVPPAVPLVLELLQRDLLQRDGAQTMTSMP